MQVTDLRVKQEGMMVWYYPTPDESTKCMRERKLPAVILEVEGSDALKILITCPSSFPILKRNVRIKVNLEDVGVWDYPEQIKFKTTYKVLTHLPAFILALFKIKL